MPMGNPKETKYRPLSQVLVMTLVWGLAAHGFILTNKFSTNDDIRYLFGAGATITSGRWFLEVAARLTRLVLGGPLCSSPLFCGLISLLLLGLSLWMLFDLFDISDFWVRILLTGAAVASPSMAGLLGYLFTAPFYMLALALCVAGAWLICRRHTLLWTAVGVGCIACGIGIYQAYLPVVLCILLVNFIWWIVSEQKITPKKALGQVLFYCGASAGFMGVYFLASKVCLAVTGGNLTDYNGISQVWDKSLRFYLNRAVYAMGLMLHPGQTGMYPFRTELVYYGILALTVGYALYLLADTFRRDACRGWFLLAALAAWPLGMNFIYVMCSEHVHALMLYAHAILPMLLMCLAKACPKLPGRRAAAVLLALLCVGYVRYDNYCYTRFAFFQQRSTNYLNRFVSRIESVPGYDETMPVAYIGEKIPIAQTFREIPGFAEAGLMPLTDYQAIIDDWDWRIYLDYWCGFAPEEVDPAAFWDNPQVKAMPPYPAAGSVCIIDGTVVVKLDAAE